MEPCELAKLIPRDKLDYLFQHSNASADMDFTFLCFDNIYKELLDCVPKDKIILDLGCAYATQNWYFREYGKYIGVDCIGNNDSVIHTENSEFYFMTIQDFIKKKLPLLSLDLNNVFAVCSYVPDKSAMDLVLETFPYYRVYYPGLISVWNRPPDEHESPPEKSSLDDLISSAESKRAVTTVTDSGLCSTRTRE